MIWAEVLTGLTVIGFVYGFLQNFKADIQSSLEKVERRMERTEDRMVSLEERIFFLATGKTLKEAILEEKMKREEKR